MMPRQPRYLAATVLLMLCICFTTVKPERCVDNKPEKGTNACPCEAFWPNYLFPAEWDKLEESEKTERLRKCVTPRGVPECVEFKPEEGMNACPCRVKSPVSLVYPAEWSKLEASELCKVYRRCERRPQCCIDLCGTGGAGYICNSENDCNKIDETGKWLECKKDRYC
ncbi:hypothetical protein DFQ26_006705, partial [Actinomortierella ambigua]